MAEQYELWVGVEAELYCTDGAGAAICFDGDEAYFTLNHVVIAFEK